MQFFRRNQTGDTGGPYCVLYDDAWNDWYKYETQFTLVVVDEHGTSHTPGSVKIASRGLTTEQRRPALDVTFDGLGEDYYSVGQTEDYYEVLSKLSSQLRERILVGLRDISYNTAIYEQNAHDYVMGESVLRSVSTSSIRGKFHKLAHGDATATAFNFSIPVAGMDLAMEFNVIPEAMPPTNVHVIIGRNGVGKTTTLRNYMQSLFAVQTKSITSQDLFKVSPAKDEFANLVAITFSAFDEFIPIPDGAKGINGMRFAYVGLRPESDSSDPLVASTLPPKTLADLAKEFTQSVKICRVGARAERWLRALEILESDPLFSDAEVTGLVSGTEHDANMLFLKLSAGHRAVLLSITRLVEYVDERSLVVMDEPESHLHPPLLSAFVRAVSDLLIRRNGVAVIATHSPVILQEVPSSCVWMMRRTGGYSNLERPTLETFGEGVGVLTREVFGLEVVQSGFNKLVEDYIIENSPDYEQLLQAFGGKLGSEARTLARSLIYSRKAAE